jgi:hypothetical protein
MTRVRLVCAGAAALVAAVGLAPAVATGATSATAASRASTICVPLVVDARSIGVPVDTECTTVKKGATGIDVLEAGGHPVTFRRDGLLCTIDGLPKSGCADVDNTHYWVYYHREAHSSSWDYSNEGASTYQPDNNETEGWVYDDGAGVTPKPDNIPRAVICAAKVTPSPTPTPTPTRSRTHTGMGAPPTTSATPSPTRHRSARATPSETKSATTATAIPTPSPTAVARGDSGDHATGGHGNATGTIIAAAVIAVLIGAAAMTVRRRRS